jgi:hypothetical protein
MNTRTNKDFYVISVLNDGETVEKFYDIDSASGYPYWGKRWISAKHFSTQEEAIATMNKELAEEPSKLSDGTVYPQPLLQSALALNRSKPKGSAMFFVKKVSLGECIASRSYTAEIFKPVSYNYKGDLRDLFMMQAKHNDDRGVPCLRQVCSELERNNVEGAKAICSNDWDKISNYPDCANWLKDNGFVDKDAYVLGEKIRRGLPQSASNALIVPEGQDDPRDGNYVRKVYGGDHFAS